MYGLINDTCNFTVHGTLDAELLFKNIEIVSTQWGWNMNDSYLAFALVDVSIQKLRCTIMHDHEHQPLKIEIPESVTVVFIAL